MPVSASESADLVDGLFNTMMTIATGLFIIVQGALVYSMIRFRRRSGETGDGPPIHGNIGLEVFWTAIPAVIVLGISIYSFDVYNTMGGLDPMAGHNHHSAPMAHQSGMAIAAPLMDGMEDGEMAQDQENFQVALGIGAPLEAGDKQPDVVVNVMGLQYAWIFTYPESGVVSGELHLPVGQDVSLRIGAQDVIHAFWVPEFRLKQDAIPGREAELRFVPTREGDYPVICAELCGAYHGAMKTRVLVESADGFEQWIQSQQVAALQTDGADGAIAVRSETAAEGQDAPTSHSHHGAMASLGVVSGDALAQIPHHALPTPPESV